MFTVQHQSMGNMDAGNPCWPCLWQSGVLIFWHWYLTGPVSLELSFPHCPPPTARALGFRLIAVWILPWVSLPLPSHFKAHGFQNNCWFVL